MSGLDWSSVLPATVGLISLVAAVTSAFAHKRQIRTIRAKQARLLEEVSQEATKTLRQKVAKAPLEENLLAQVLSTSTAQGPLGIAEGPASIAQLREQISDIEQKIQQRNEIVEISRIDPVLEATIKASIENLTKRIEFLEKTRLEKWDIALVFFQVFGGIGVLFGLVMGLIKYFFTKGQ